MLPDELRDPLKKITKDSPILGLLLAVLLIAIGTFSVKHFNRDGVIAKQLENCEGSKEAERKFNDSVLREENKILRNVVNQNYQRKPSQDTAIKIINKVFE